MAGSYPVDNDVAVPSGGWWRAIEDRSVRTGARWRLAAAAVIVAGAAVLSGCDSWAADPVSYSRVDDIPIARICLPVTITSIELRTLDTKDDYEGSVVWSASGSADVPEGFEFAVGAAPPGLQVTRGPTDRAAAVEAIGDRFSIGINATDSYGDHEFSTLIDLNDFEDSDWLNAWGATDAPCVRDVCPPGYTCLNQWPQPTGPALIPEPTWTSSPPPAG
ncbi:hypothetical protein G5T42_17175 [Microbacterium sp. 4R-513]|uniref:hypothetical protein n=1 Tax=Microbacterium sp. 4R-513 TaxID=2567934 RepID=UPI0013E1FBFE|nr:hypothetical protein [Microbacterium sp. 4R-513]QIG40991.1 hypothetical protein G5T42_17175 [Microbacterium sp. 4R-513]